MTVYGAAGDFSSTVFLCFGLFCVTAFLRYLCSTVMPNCRFYNINI